MHFDAVEAINIWARDNDSCRYRELRHFRKVNTSDAESPTLLTRIKHIDPSEDWDTYELIFFWRDATLMVRGDFFEVAEKPRPLRLVASDEDSGLYEMFEDDDPEPWYIEFSFLPKKALSSTIDDLPQPDPPPHDIQTMPSSKKSSPQPISSREAPLNAKTYKDAFNEMTQALASQAPEFLDEDGQARLYVRFLNGRTVQIEHREALSDAELTDIFYIHETDHLSLKRYWTSISSAIVFSTAFGFVYKDDADQEVELILRRCPDDEHPADEFCDQILTGMQMELEQLLDDEIKQSIEQGFERLENLIVGSGLPVNPALGNLKPRFSKLKPSVKKLISR